MNGFFRDSHGNKSSSRLAFFIVVCAGVCLAAVQVIFRNDVAGASAIIGAFGTLAGVIKGVGKYQELQEKSK